MQILIVDDHAGVRSLIRELLVDCLPAWASELRFRECDNGQCALDSVALASPELVTVDLRMHGMNGIDCVRRLRERLPRACIVVVTQFGNEALQERARSAGADSVVFKDELARLQDVTLAYVSRR